MPHRIFLLLPLLLLFVWSSSPAQSPSYFPNVVIVKYKPDHRIAELKSKGVEDPKESVQKFLSDLGIQNRKPFRDPRQSPGLPLGEEARKAGEELSRIYEISYFGPADPAMIASKLSAMKAVEYAEPKFIRKMQFTPNDPVGNPYLNYHSFDDAWDITTGSRDVLIAVVDGGVGYLHTDLSNKMWINGDEIPAAQRAEVDQNGDGTITSSEVQQYLEQNNEDADGNGAINLSDGIHPNSSLTTGSDTDGNGYADDLYGWDFWESGGFNGPVVEDNDPIHDGTDHGTHVAGIAAAETDNGTGIYGAGFRSRYMAIKAGGIADDPSTPDNESNAIGFGFDGIIYAAEQGADIINCSWGGGGFSQAELDVIDFATSRGALVVAAAGNSSEDQVIFPAAYRDVLAVGSIETTNSVADYSSYGYNLDVLTTGSGIESTTFNNNYESKTGTSMSTPVASGLAALIRAQNPDWSPRRIGTQIRATAISVDRQNPDRYEHKLGGGKVHAFNAVNTPKPGIVIRSEKFLNNGGQKLGPGEEGRIVLDIINYGAATDNLNLTLTNPGNQNISILEGSRQLGSLATDDSAEVSFAIRIEDGFNLNDKPLFRIDFRDSNNDYWDFGIAIYENLLFDTMAANNVKTSIAADGTVGFTNPLSGEGGVGFIPRRPTETGFSAENNLLFEGGLMMSIDGAVYDAVRSTNGGLSRDFDPQNIFRLQSPGQVSAVDGNARFSIGDSGDVRRATIDLETFAFDDPALSNVVYVKYTVTNPSSFVVLKNIYIGLFNDWDIGDNALNNSASFSAQDSILYVFDEDPGTAHPLVAVAQLGSNSSLLTIDNTVNGRQDSVTFGLYDGFTENEKLTALRAGTAKTSVSNTDVSAVTASGPFALGPRARLTTGFIYAFGYDLTELRNQVAQARGQAPFRVSAPGLAVSDEIPQETRLFQNYPNPFNPTTQLRIDLDKPQQVKLAIYDVLGRRIRVLVDRRLDARTHIITFNAERLSSGIYFARLKTPDRTQTIPMTLIK